MSWESCVVLLNSDSASNFYTGDIVTGNVVLELKQKQHIERINFRVVGVSKAQWSRSAPTVPFIKVYSEKKKVLDIDIDIFNELAGKTIGPGIATFQFHFLLPPDLPSSYESDIAKVYYYIVIDGKASFKFKKQKIVPFVVQRTVDVNHLEEYLAPEFTEFEKKFWRSGEFKIRFKTFKAFAPRQQAPFEISITNEKKVYISKINVILLRKIRYEVSSGYAEEELKICTVGHKKFSNTVLETCIFSMEIPHTIPSSIQNQMVNISYIFRVEVFFSFHNPVFKEMPIIITTIPVLHYDFENCF